MTAKACTPVALTAWTERNERQQRHTLPAIYLIDQQIEQIRRSDAR
ncbi:hypothetical protein [Salinispora mooreana]|nr:hypothetical protein [Salinispora mooreana]